MIHIFLNDTATTEIYTLSLHDALPILAADDEPVDSEEQLGLVGGGDAAPTPPRVGTEVRHARAARERREPRGDRKSTRLNSSHANISYAVFCLKKKTVTSASIKPT